MTDFLGQQLGNYHLTRLLGQGGFADVYLGEHVFLKTQVAIKVLQVRVTGSSLDDFLNEARTIAYLEHPNIVKVFDFGVQDAIPFLVMSYAPNGSLRKYYPAGTPMPSRAVVSYVKQVASALQYAHTLKVTHRDIKPENMLLGRHNEVLLTDFGIALITESSRYERTQGVAGTAAYMAPEQILGKPRPASDQYALGIVVYEWLSGSRPFKGGFNELCAQHIHATPPSLREKVPTISPETEQVVMTALAKEPQYRFSSIQAFANALEQAIMPSSPSGPFPVFPPVINDTATEAAKRPIPTPDILNAAPPGTFTPYPQGFAPTMPAQIPVPSGPTPMPSGSVPTPVPSGPTPMPSGSVPTPVPSGPTPPSYGPTPMPSGPTPNPISYGDMASTVPVAPVAPQLQSTSQAEKKGISRRAVIGLGLTGLGVVAVGGAATWALLTHNSSGTGSTLPPGPEPTVQTRGRNITVYSGHIKQITSIAWAKGNQYVASASLDNTVQIWDLSGHRITNYTQHTQQINSIAWSPDGQYIASASDDHTVKIWNPLTGNTIHTLPNSNTGFTSVTWSPDSTHVAAGGYDSTVHIWDITNGTDIYKYTGHTKQVNSVAWSLDGTHIASGGYDSTVQVWNASISLGSPVITYHGHQKTVSSVAWSHDGARILSGSYDETAKLWTVINGTTLLTDRHTQYVNTVALSPDEKTCAVAGGDSIVRLWQASSGKPVYTYRENKAIIYGMAWSPNGQYIASGGDDNKVYVWTAT